MTETAALTLTEFLLARIAEDEVAARGSTPGPWEAWSGASGGGGEYVHSEPSGYTFGIDPGVTGDEGWQTARGDAAHIARHDPARVLAEVEAKRRIVAGYAADPSPWRGCGDDCEWAAVEWVLSVLALPFADHPDYRPEWRP